MLQIGRKEIQQLNGDRGWQFLFILEARTESFEESRLAALTLIHDSRFTRDFW